MDRVVLVEFELKTNRKKNKIAIMWQTPENQTSMRRTRIENRIERVNRLKHLGSKDRSE